MHLGKYPRNSEFSIPKQSSKLLKLSLKSAQLTFVMGNNMNRYLWCYSLTDLQNDEIQEFKNHIVEKIGITDIFLSMGSNFRPHESNFRKLSNIISLMYPLRIHAMVFQDKIFLENIREKEDQIKEAIQVLGNYNVVNKENLLKGIHIDIEPHATDQFKEYKDCDEQKVRELFHNYRYLLFTIQSQIYKTGGLMEDDFFFSAATGWWYENRNYASILYLGQYLTAIVPMAYNTAQEPVGGNFELLKSKLPVDQWQQKSPLRSGVVIGLGIFEYGSYDLLMDTVESLEIYLSSELSLYFKGVAFYSDRFLTI